METCSYRSVFQHKAEPKRRIEAPLSIPKPSTILINPRIIDTVSRLQVLHTMPVEVRQCLSSEESYTIVISSRSRYPHFPRDRCWRSAGFPQVRLDLEIVMVMLRVRDSSLGRETGLEGMKCPRGLKACAVMNDFEVEVHCLPWLLVALVKLGISQTFISIFALQPLYIRVKCTVWNIQSSLQEMFWCEIGQLR